METAGTCIKIAATWSKTIEISVPIGGTSDKMKEGSVRTCNDSSRMSAQERLPVNCNRIGKTSIAIAKICEATAKV